MITTKEEFFELLKKKIEERKIPFKLDENGIRAMEKYGQLSCPITYFFGCADGYFYDCYEALNLQKELAYAIIDAADLSTKQTKLRQELLKVCGIE